MTDKNKTKPETVPAPLQAAPVPVPVIEEADKAILSQASLNRRIALLQAEKILAQHELAEMTFKYIKVQLFMKYGLTANDQISETGEVIKGAV